MTRYSAHTLGSFIEALRGIPSGHQIKTDEGEFILSVDSYRGNYFDLALEPVDFPVKQEASTVGFLLKVCADAVGKTFQDYKGGDYKMNLDTELYVSRYGDASYVRPIGIDEGDEYGQWVIITVQL